MKKRRIGTAVAAAVFLLGAAVLLYPCAAEQTITDCGIDPALVAAAVVTNQGRAGRCGTEIQASPCALRWYENATGPQLFANGWIPSKAGK